MTVAPRSPISVNYLLEDTTLFGGVKVPLHHANLLHRLGHSVTVVSRGGRPSWFEVEASFVTVPEFTDETVPPADVHVATYWTTIGPAAELTSGTPVHYCQGYEASYTHNRHEHDAIRSAYQRPLAGFAVSAHLVDILRANFGRPARLVPPILEDIWRPDSRSRRNPRPRVLVLHPAEIDWKGVATALDAVALLRGRGFVLELVRISQWPLTESERSIVNPDEFHCHLLPRDVARLVAGCDLLLAPSWEQEGFGLPVLEAMACGVPVVGSRIAAFEGFAADAAELVDPHDAEAFADAAGAILDDGERWLRMRRAGIEVADRFSTARGLPVLEAALRWVVDGEWRREP